jgi:hypothetical protein
MLREDALDYLYDNVNHKGFSFEIMWDMIKSHFETDEHKQGMMTKWNATTLKTIMAKNEDKSTEKETWIRMKDLSDSYHWQMRRSLHEILLRPQINLAEEPQFRTSMPKRLEKISNKRKRPT